MVVQDPARSSVDSILKLSRVLAVLLETDVELSSFE
jgi:hypothetical protein